MMVSASSGRGDREQADLAQAPERRERACQRAGMRDVRHVPCYRQRAVPLLNRARARLRGAREHRDEVAHEVVDVLDPDREPDEVVRHLEARARERGVRHGARVLDQALDAAEALAQRPHAGLGERGVHGRRGRRCTRKAIMPPKRRIWRFAVSWPGMRREARVEDVADGRRLGEPASDPPPRCRSGAPCAPRASWRRAA